MTSDELLTTCRTAGIILQARGDRLHVEAPPGIVTPALHAELARHKPALLASLAPDRVVTLKGGIVVAVAALRLALSLEDRGFTMTFDASQQFTITPPTGLTETDLAAIQRWRLHLGAIVRYDADAQEPRQ